MDASIDFLEWDSRHFGVKIARLREPINPHRVEEGVAAAERASVRCLTALIDANQPATIVAAEAAGFRCYDVRIELEREESNTAEGAAIVATEADLPGLEEIARARFTDSRFYADPGFPDDRAAEMYALWVRRGVADENRLLLTSDDRDGFVVCQLDAAARTGVIELIAVAAQASGNGLGTRLLKGADAAFNAAELTHARVVTQARNVTAQRLYQRHGYRTRDAALWLHRWTT